jgi:hypothetical protein
MLEYKHCASTGKLNHIAMYLIIGCMFEYDLYWSGEVGCGTSITLETGRDDWRGQMKHKVAARNVQYV